MSTSTGLRERKKQQTRRAIQRAALELFAVRGFRETTIAQVANAADVSVRTVAVHFPAKEDLVLTLGFEGLDDLARCLQDRPTGIPALDALHEWVTAQVRQADEQPEAEESRELLRLVRRITAADPGLEMRLRGRDLRVEDVLAAEIAADLGLARGALAARLAAAAVMAGLRSVTSPPASEDAGDVPDADQIVSLLDDSVDFARAGLRRVGLSEPA